MRVACVQMDMRLGDADYNFAHAEELVRAAVERDAARRGGAAGDLEHRLLSRGPGRLRRPGRGADKARLLPLARELDVNIVAGSVANRRAAASTTPPMSLTGPARSSPSTTRPTSSPPPGSTSPSARAAAPAASPWRARLRPHHLLRHPLPGADPDPDPPGGGPALRGEPVAGQAGHAPGDPGPGPGH